MLGRMKLACKFVISLRDCSVWLQAGRLSWSKNSRLSKKRFKTRPICSRWTNCSSSNVILFHCWVYLFPPVFIEERSWKGPNEIQKYKPSPLVQGGLEMAIKVNMQWQNARAMEILRRLKKLKKISRKTLWTQSKTFVSCSGNIIKVKKFYKLGAES